MAGFESPRDILKSNFSAGSHCRIFQPHGGGAHANTSLRGIFALTLVIQEFVYSLTFISSVERMTVSVGVPVALVRGDVYYWGSLMAACLITSIPIAVLYNFFLDRFIAGFTVGAIR